MTYPFVYWICGSALGLLLISVFHPFLFHKSMVFIPLSIFFGLQIIMYFGLLIADPLIDIEANSPLLFFVGGMLDCPCCFLMYFLIPLKIATHYRLTQEVTPAGTVISASIAITYIGSRILYHLF